MANNNVNAQVDGAKLTENNVDIKDLVVVENSQAVTTSLKIAEVFGKQHKDVLKAIRNIIATAQNCAFVDNQVVSGAFKRFEIEQPMPVGDGIKNIPAYVISRDGFSWLAMGFTGEKALAFKIAYTNAFNAMEAKLRENQEQSLIDNNSETFSLVEIVDGKAITTSLKVAKVFEKPHPEILRLISDLDCDFEFRKQNLEIQLTVYKTPTGKTRRETVRAMTCAGFNRLVSQLNGKKAAQMKEVYLQAFYDAEQKIQTVVPQTAQSVDPKMPVIDNPITKRFFDLQVEHDKLMSEISLSGQESMSDVTELLNDVEKAHSLRYNAISKLIMMKSKHEAARLASLYYHGVTDDE